MFSDFIGSIRSRKAAHWSGVTLGILLGTVSFVQGMGACFSVAGWLDTIGLLAALSLLPLAVVAIFRPHFAARAVGVSWLLVLIGICSSITCSGLEGSSLLDLVMFASCFFALPGGVVALLLYASRAGVSPGARLKDRGP